MVATDVASRGIGMIQKPPTPSSTLRLPIPFHLDFITGRPPLREVK